MTKIIAYLRGKAEVFVFGPVGFLTSDCPSQVVTFFPWQKGLLMVLLIRGRGQIVDPVEMATFSASAL